MAFDVSETVELARSWWTFILRGVLAILFGLLAFFAPLFGIAILIGLFAAWALIDGVTDIVTGIRTRSRDRNWWLHVLEGLVGIAAGAIALLFPDLAATALVLIIGIWAIVTGIIEIWSAIKLREQIDGEVWLGLAGAASILFGILVIAFPAGGALSIVWLIGGFSIAFGAFLVILGFRLRGIDALARRDAATDNGR